VTESTKTRAINGSTRLFIPFEWGGEEGGNDSRLQARGAQCAEGIETQRITVPSEKSETHGRKILSSEKTKQREPKKGGIGHRVNEKTKAPP